MKKSENSKPSSQLSQILTKTDQWSLCKTIESDESFKNWTQRRLIVEIQSPSECFYDFHLESFCFFLFTSGAGLIDINRFRGRAGRAMLRDDLFEGQFFQYHG